MTIFVTFNFMKHVKHTNYYAQLAGIQNVLVVANSNQRCQIFKIFTYKIISEKYGFFEYFNHFWDAQM